MAGSAQAANLTGMLNNIAATVGEMGKASDWTHQNIRDYSAPKLDQNDPESMLEYADYLQRNGQQEAAIQMQARAAARQRQDKQTKGMAQIQQLSAVLEANRGTMDANQIAALQGHMAKLGAEAGLTPEQMTGLMTRNDGRQDAANTQSNTVRGLDQVDTAQNDTRKYQGEQIRVQDEELALLEKQRVDQVDQFTKSLDFNYEQLEDNYNLESAKIQNTSRSLDLTETMNIANIERLGVLNHINLREADDMEIRTELFEAYQKDQISTNALARILMGDQNARANELAPLEQAVLKARIQTASVLANFTEAQTAQVYEAVGLAQDSRGLIVEGIRLDNLFKEVKTDLVGAQVQSTEWNTEYIRTNIDAVKAQMKLDGEKFDFLKRSTKFDQDIDMGKLRLSALGVGIERDRADAAAAAIFENIRSSQFRDEILAVNTMAGAVSPLFNLAMNANIDVSNTAAVANGRLAFIEKTGSTSAGAIYDDAMKRRIEVASMQQDLSGRVFKKENTQAPTVARLTAMGMPEERAEQIMALSGLENKDKAIQAWITQVNTSPYVAEPSQQMMDMYMPTAKKLKYQVFGGGFGIPNSEYWSTGIGDSVIDDDVWQASARAMARAVSSGLPDSEVMMAGISAMMPYAIETGDTGVVGTVYNLQQGLEDN
jgi:hypothetical protein